MGIDINVLNVFDWDDGILQFFYKFGNTVWTAIINLLGGWVVNPTSNSLIGEDDANIYQIMLTILDNAELKTFMVTCLTAFFLWSVIEKLCRQGENTSPLSILLEFCRLLFFSYIADNLKSIVEIIVQFGGEVAGVLSGAVPALANIEELISEEETWMSTYLIYDQANVITGFISTILAIIYAFVMCSCAINMVKAVVELYSDLFFSISFAPVMAGTMTSGGHFGQVAVQYFKSLFAKVLCFSAIYISMSVSLLMALSVSALISSAISEKLGTQAAFYSGIIILACGMMRAVLISSATAGIENRVHRNLGL